MSKVAAKKRVEKLRALIDHHRYLYHVKDIQEISPEALDALKHELFMLEQQYPELVAPDSPTQRVGGEPLEKFRKVEHTLPMLSIEDVFSAEELKDWEEYLIRLVPGGAPRYFAELKIDGFAVSLLYKNGIFVRGATRGNGRVGEDVTQNLKTIESIPLKLSPVEGKIPPVLEVRGEVYMAKKDFESFNRERVKRGEEPYANPRNLAAGSIRQLDPSVAAARPLKFMAYDIVTDVGQKLHSKEHGLLAVLGFKTDSTARVCDTLLDVAAYWREIQKKRDSLPFLIDGIVASVNDNAAFLSLGVAGKSPRGIRACKFSGKQATTAIKDIVVQIGRTGVLTPVAVLNPVQVAGVTVSRATLHNEDEIRRLDVRVGDTVIVERAGDVIPAVVKVFPELRSGNEKTFHMPKNCPSCSAALERKQGEVAVRCVNEQCPSRYREWLYHAASKKGFDIAGLGPKIIDALYEAGLVQDLTDFFILKEEDILPLERFAEKSADNIISAVKERKSVPLSRFLYALGIQHVGEETAQKLAERFADIKAIAAASVETLKDIEDVGEVVAQSISEWFKKKENKALILKFQKVGVVVQKEQQERKNDALKGMKFVLTGTLSVFSRDEAAKQIRLRGGEVADSVSRETTHVVAGENPGSKLTKARALGTHIISEQEFRNILG